MTGWSAATPGRPRRSGRERPCSRRLPELASIPFEGTTLPGYYFRAAPGASARATVILLGGYDGTAEELYFLNGAAALERGYNVLAFDGPGQGSALIQQGMVLRPDFETVIAAVIDHLLGRAETDPARMPWSARPAPFTMPGRSAGSTPSWTRAGDHRPGGGRRVRRAPVRQHGQVELHQQVDIHLSLVSVLLMSVVHILRRPPR